MKISFGPYDKCVDGKNIRRDFVFGNSRKFITDFYFNIPKYTVCNDKEKTYRYHL